MSQQSPAPSAIQPEWNERIPDEEWAVYREVIQQARSRRIRFAFGGAFATALYTGELRNTKDFDLYILPEDRERMVQAMNDAGLRDYFDRLHYDQSWIYRGSRGDIIVDAIWQMANHRAVVDQQWLTGGPEVELKGERLRAIPLEELVWSKLYVLQRERCDWTDIFNLLDAQIQLLDWEHLLRRLGDDAPLLAAALRVFVWLAPARLSAIPSAVRTRIWAFPETEPGDPDLSRFRADLLDSRPWFRRPLG
jgi:Uncharacterised nucleotidyltransferase